MPRATIRVERIIETEGGRVVSVRGIKRLGQPRPTDPILDFLDGNLSPRSKRGKEAQAELFSWLVTLLNRSEDFQFEPGENTKWDAVTALFQPGRMLKI